LRLAYAGTPEFARAALQALHEAGHDIALVLTQPDRPAGRGLRLQASPVKQYALAHGLALAQPAGLRLDGRFAEQAAAARAALEQAAPEVLVVAAYGLILPPWVLALPPQGGINIHGSLLPRWRGAAPIQRAIEAGDAATGITVMQMDAGLDTGAMRLVESTPIGAADTAATLHDRLAAIGARLIVQALAALQHGSLPLQPQPPEGTTYARKVDKGEATIDWREPAKVLERRLRAFDPSPGCSTELAGQAVKLWRGRVVPGAGAPGTFLPAGRGRLVVACGDGALELLEMQLAGGRRIAARDFLQRHPLVPG
jgi:methionyl-tRNA formyltransferase